MERILFWFLAFSDAFCCGFYQKDTLFIAAVDGNLRISPPLGTPPGAVNLPAGRQVCRAMLYVGWRSACPTLATVGLSANQTAPSPISSRLISETKLLVKPMRIALLWNVET